MRLHSFSPQTMLQVFHADILSILTRVPEVQCDVIDRSSTDITVETKGKWKTRWKVSEVIYGGFDFFLLDQGSSIRHEALWVIQPFLIHYLWWFIRINIIFITMLIYYHMKLLLSLENENWIKMLCLFNMILLQQCFSDSRPLHGVYLTLYLKRRLCISRNWTNWKYEKWI